MLLSKNVGLLSLYPIVYFQQTTVVETIIFTTIPTTNDPYLNYVVLNINGNGSLSGNNNTFLDTGYRGITAVGTVTQGTFSPFSPAGWSGYFNGTSYLSASNNTTLLSSGDFTIEMWVYFNQAEANATQAIYTNFTSWSSNGNGIYFGKHSGTGSGKVSVWFSNHSTAASLLTEPTYPPNNQWVHYALVRTGRVISIYRNGVQTISGN